MDVASGQKVEREIVQNVKMLPLSRCTSFSEGADCTCGLLVLTTGVAGEYWRVGIFGIHLESRSPEFEFDSEWSTIKIV